MTRQISTCNLCDTQLDSPWESLFREGASCSVCGSSVRMREVVCAVNEIENFFEPSQLNIVGLSDADLVAKYFKKKFGDSYQNTFYDSDPKLDIGNLSKRDFGSADILISSDVFEHVFFPLRNSILGAFNLLKPSGMLVLTMPWNTWQDSVEHFPWMVSYKVIQNSDGTHSVIGEDASGQSRNISNPIFHGGPGNTLEMRKINLFVLIDELERCGFTEVKVHNESRPEFGIRRADGVVGVITAQRSPIVKRVNPTSFVSRAKQMIRRNFLGV